ncbi:MAG: DUF2189 domain-containing protein [Beijerinckiaceae bacterium]|nr:DUF2189 domain-containing protein [Beijerinckiaceae bacterium]
MPAFHSATEPEQAAIYPSIRKIGLADLKAALAKGTDDFLEMPSFHVFLALIYPIALMWFAGYALPLLFPVLAGFALIGPVAGIGLYEMSRRRELGLDTSWEHAFNIVRSQSISSILALGLLLLAIFVCWVFAAYSLYVAFFGTSPPATLLALITEIFGTAQGWKLIGLGTVAGFVFAVVALSISAVSFPLLLEFDVGAAAAVRTSVKAVLVNPFTMAVWGLIVAAFLAIGSLLLFVGLAVAVPILAHSSWHLYRRVVVAGSPLPQ